MDSSDAITSYAQSEKIKSSLIWINQLLEFMTGLPEDRRTGCEQGVRTYMELVGNEIHFSCKVAGDPSWTDVAAHMDKALLMMRSGAPHEAPHHVTGALSEVTGVAQRAMTFLKEKELL